MPPFPRHQVHKISLFRGSECSNAPALQRLSSIRKSVRKLCLRLRRSAYRAIESCEAVRWDHGRLGCVCMKKGDLEPKHLSQKLHCRGMAMLGAKPRRRPARTPPPRTTGTSSSPRTPRTPRSPRTPRNPEPAGPPGCPKPVKTSHSTVY